MKIIAEIMEMALTDPSKRDKARSMARQLCEKFPIYQ